jgi:deoxycytidine triphosphate deaminase
MILSDEALEALIASDQVLRDYDPNLIRHCGCELRLGSVFFPTTGEQQGGSAPWAASNRVKGWLATLSGAAATAPSTWGIGPSETMVIVTKETVTIPTTHCATYGQLNRLANSGLMLLNNSIVEPGYSGPLSCVLVNFSSQRVVLRQDQPVAKINFYQLVGSPKHRQQSIERTAYELNLANTATKFPRSFMDISGVEERITARMGTVVRKSVAFGGIVIAMLLLWSQLEGVFSDWIWKRTGLMSTSKQIELSVAQQQLKNEQSVIELTRANQQLDATVKDLSRTVELLRAKVK